MATYVIVIAKVLSFMVELCSVEDDVRVSIHVPTRFSRSNGLEIVSLPILVDNGNIRSSTVVLIRVVSDHYYLGGESVV